MKNSTLALILSLIPAWALAAPQAVIDAAGDSTVMIMAFRSSGGGAYGSGAYVGHGLFITNDHVVNGSDRFVIKKPGTAIQYDAELIYTNSVADVAILFVLEDVILDPVVFAGSDKRGRRWAAGYGSSLHDDLPGHFMRIYGGGYARFDVENRHWYRFSGSEGAAISGDSGGPAFNKDGEYIGPIWGTDDVNTYAVRNSTIRQIAEGLAK